MIESVKVRRIREGNSESIDDDVAVEIPLTLVINEKELVTLLCSPSEIEDLVTGFLFTSGLIMKIEDIKGLVIDEQRWSVYLDLVQADTGMVFKRLYTAGCGRGTLFYNAFDLISRQKIICDFKIKAQEINALMIAFQKQSEVYLKTGGVHSAALADKERILIFKEDIGRHNAIDKIIGQGLKSSIPFENKVIISSGRISSDLLLKAKKCNIPMVISRSAPTNQAIKLAKEMGITLVGFARGSRMNIYSEEDRVA